MASLLLANVHFQGKNRKEMMPHLQRALDLAARFDYEYWLREEIQKYPDLFKDEDINEKLPLDLRDNLAGAKPQIKTPPIRIIETAEKITDLTIKVLGHVDIYRDITKPFAADAWTTRRARDIFCHIATSPHRRVSKDVLIDEFWKDEDLSAIEKNFHPTISHIRKALNSRQTFKQNFIVFRDGAYQLNPELSYSIDTEEFENFIAEAEKAKKENDTEKFLENLESAHDLYRGEFMSGIYEDWAEEKRNYFAEQHLRVLNALAKFSFKEKSWSKALKFANEILTADPFREDMQRLLMKTLAAQGKRAAVKEHFENLQELLKKELGVAPAPETQKVFQELLK
jgi:DNA-binding SARP family transcriptional activator